MINRRRRKKCTDKAKRTDLNNCKQKAHSVKNKERLTGDKGKGSVARKLIDKRKSPSDANHTENQSRRRQTALSSYDKDDNMAVKNKKWMKKRIVVKGKGKGKKGSVAAQQRNGRTKKSASEGNLIANRSRMDQTTSSNDDDSDDASWPCIICGECYSEPGEQWLECQICKHWAHEACTDLSGYFVCTNCESDDDLE